MWSMLWVLGCDGEDPPVEPPAVEPDDTDPEGGDPTADDCVSGTIGADGGALADGDLTVTFPAGAFGAGTESGASLCPATVEGASSAWALETDLPLVLPAEVAIAGIGPGTALFVPGVDGTAERSIAGVLDGDRLTGPMYRAGTFYGAPDPRVLVTYTAEGLADLLFVIDNSCSMGDEQSNLIGAFPVVVNYFAGQTEMDFHVGVVSTDLDDPRQSGKLQEVRGARWIDASTPDPVSVFEQMARLGTSGSGSEQGIGAAYTALAIEGDGYNAGFLRDDSRLAIAVVSDEPDVTRAGLVTPNEMIDYLEGLDDEHDGVVFHGLVDPALGRAYVQVSDGVGGGVMNIQAADFGVFLEGVLLGMQPRMALDPAAVAEPEAWWLPIAGEQVRIDEALVASDGEQVVVDATGLGEDGAIWLLYSAAP